MWGRERERERKRERERERERLTDCDVCESVEEFVVCHESTLDLVPVLAAAKTLHAAMKIIKIMQKQQNMLIHSMQHWIPVSTTNKVNSIHQIPMLDSPSPAMIHTTTTGGGGTWYHSNTHTHTQLARICTIMHKLYSIWKQSVW